MLHNNLLKPLIYPEIFNFGPKLFEIENKNKKLETIIADVYVNTNISLHCH